MLASASTLRMRFFRWQQSPSWSAPGKGCVAVYVGRPLHSGPADIGYKPLAGKVRTVFSLAIVSK